MVGVSIAQAASVEIPATDGTRYADDLIARPLVVDYAPPQYEHPLQRLSNSGYQLTKNNDTEPNITPQKTDFLNAIEDKCPEPSCGSGDLTDPFNDRLAILVRTDGRFNMGAFPDPLTGGSTVNSWDLMYRWPSSPGTSFTTFKIDGTNIVLGDAAGTWLETPHDSDPLTNIARWKSGDIEVTQVLKIVPNYQTGEEDVGKISYILTNTGATSHEVGTRIMIDTEINRNDGAAFRVPETGIIDTETIFEGATLPENFQVFFDVTDNIHVASGTITGGEVPIYPDKLIVAYWPSIYSSLYEYSINPSRSILGDSAYAVYWYPETLGPGESFTHTTFYGLSEFDADLAPPLALGVSSPAELINVEELYEPNPFTILATVLNNGGSTANNVEVSITLPENFEIVSGTQTETIGNLNVNEERQVSWIVYAKPIETETTYAITVEVVADGVNPKAVERLITIPASAFHDDATNSFGYYKNGDTEVCIPECEIAVQVVQGSGGDPINTRTGNFDYSVVDISVQTEGDPISFARHYSSLGSGLIENNLGVGWSHNDLVQLILPGSPSGED